MRRLELWGDGLEMFPKKVPSRASRYGSPTLKNADLRENAEHRAS